MCTRPWPWPTVSTACWVAVRCWRAEPRSSASSRWRRPTSEDAMTWVNTVLQGVLLGGYYALFATGLSLMFGVMRLVNLAHGDLAVLAAFGSVALVDQFHLNPWETLIVVVPVMAAAGYALQRYLLNLTVGSTPLASILVTFGLSIIISNAL